MRVDRGSRVRIRSACVVAPSSCHLRRVSPRAGSAAAVRLRRVPAGVGGGRGRVGAARARRRVVAGSGRSVPRGRGRSVGAANPPRGRSRYELGRGPRGGRAHRGGAAGRWPLRRMGARAAARTGVSPAAEVAVLRGLWRVHGRARRRTPAPHTRGHAAACRRSARGSGSKRPSRATRATVDGRGARVLSSPAGVRERERCWSGQWRPGNVVNRMRWNSSWPSSVRLSSTCSTASRARPRSWNTTIPTLVSPTTWSRSPVCTCSFRV